jgi:hypothetical protein
MMVNFAKNKDKNIAMVSLSSSLLQGIPQANTFCMNWPQMPALYVPHILAAK